MAVIKTTTFSESNISVANNTSSLTINIHFSANNQQTWFEKATLSCTCNGSTKTKTVSHSIGGSVSTSFTFSNISHNNDGTKSVNWSWKCPTGTSTLGTISASGTKALTKIARQANLTSAPNFNDEQNPTINYSNPAGNSVSALMACIASSDGQTIYAQYRNITKTGTSYTFNLTELERTALRTACANKASMPVRFYVRTNISGTNYYSILTKTLSIVNANPIFSDFTYQDTNVLARNITNSDQEIVLGYSDLQITIADNNKAIPQKNTSIKYYLINGKQITYADTVVILLEKWNSPTVEVTAVDSRGFSTKTIKNLIIANYTPLEKETINLSRFGNINEETTLTYGGQMTKILPNQSENILTTSYRFKKTNEENYTSGRTDISPTIYNDGKFSFEDLIEGDTQTGFDINYSYNVIVDVSDVLSEAQYTFTLNSGIPAIAIKENKIALHGIYDENNDADIQFNGKVSLNGEIILEDTGWVDLPLENGVTPRDNTIKWKPQVRRIGKVVYCKGQVSIPAHSSAITIATIPEGFRAPYEVRFPEFDQTSNWTYPDDYKIHVSADTTARNNQGLTNVWLID